MVTGSKLSAIGVVALVILGFGLLRTIHLGADAPVRIAPGSAALYVDEGYKTLSPRNLVLFGATHWHPRDDYPGWMEKSPFTQWAYYAAFRALGPRVESARLVSILCFSLLLAGYAWAMRGRYSPRLFYTGLGILGLESVLFFFSRAALFEIPISMFLYGLLFLIARTSRHLVRDVAVVAGAGAFLILAVKVSAFVYLFPVLLAVLCLVVLQRSSGIDKRLLVVLGAAAAGVAGILVVTAAVWSSEIALSPVDAVARWLTNPTLKSSPFLVVAGLLCAIHGVWARTDDFLGDLYRLSLVALVLLAPAILALFPYNPLRYYVPILPAYALLVLEWIHVGGARATPRARIPLLLGAVACVLLFCLTFYAGQAVNRGILVHLPLPMGEKPGLSDGAMLRFFTPIAALGMFLLWRWRGSLLHGRSVAAAQVILGLLFLTHATYTVGSFLVSPSYESQEIRRELAARVGEGESVAGDWAPFFALGTDVRALYMNRSVNRAARIEELAPDYFLYSATLEGDVSLEQLSGMPSVGIGPPLLEGIYSGRKVSLHRLEYNGKKTPIAE
jgi:hypothetical protein